MTRQTRLGALVLAAALAGCAGVSIGANDGDLAAPTITALDARGANSSLIASAVSAAPLPPSACPSGAVVPGDSYVADVPVGMLDVRARDDDSGIARLTVDVSGARVLAARTRPRERPTQIEPPTPLGMTRVSAVGALVRSDPFMQMEIAVAPNDPGEPVVVDVVVVDYAGRFTDRRQVRFGGLGALCR